MIAAGHVREIDVAEVNGRVFVNNSVGRPLSGHGAAARAGAGEARPLQAAGDALGELRLAPPLPPPPPLDQRAGPGGADPDAAAVRRQQPLPGEPVRPRQAGAARRGRALPLRDPREEPRCTCSGPAFAGFSASSTSSAISSPLMSSEAEISADRPILTLSADGETVRMETPLRYRIRPKALRLIVPER